MDNGNAAVQEASFNQLRTGAPSAPPPDSSQTASKCTGCRAVLPMSNQKHHMQRQCALHQPSHRKRRKEQRPHACKDATDAYPPTRGSCASREACASLSASALATASANRMASSSAATLFLRSRSLRRCALPLPATFRFATASEGSRLRHHRWSERTALRFASASARRLLRHHP